MPRSEQREYAANAIPQVLIIGQTDSQRAVISTRKLRALAISRRGRSARKIRKIRKVFRTETLEPCQTMAGKY